MLSLGFFFSGGERSDSYAEGGKYKEGKKGKDSSLQSQRSMHILGDKLYVRATGCHASPLISRAWRCLANSFVTNLHHQLYFIYPSGSGI